MNCQLCQKELEAYRDGNVPEGIRVMVEAHLKSCSDCTEMYNLVTIAEKVISQEKNELSNPFLSTRIMAGIEELEQQKANNPAFQKVLKPVLIGLSVAIAIFTGILMGNIYNPVKASKPVPVEMAYMNDAAIESINLFSNE